MEPKSSVRAWDLPTRLFHWTLVALIVCAWVSFEFAEVIGDVTLKWHRANGLAILTLLVWRLMWGLFGSSTSRFASFVRSPVSAIGYARDLAAGTPRRFLGHNPLGGWMVLALLAALLTQAAFGLFAIDDNDLTGGPLSHLVSEKTNKWATGRHDFIFHFLILPLAAIHVIANVLYGRLKGEPLNRAMMTGKKPTAAYEDAAEAQIPSGAIARAVVCLLIAAAIVLGGLWLAGGKFI